MIRAIWWAVVSELDIMAKSVLVGSLVGDGWDVALMMTQQNVCWWVSLCLAMWTVMSLWRHVAHPHLVAAAPVCLAGHKTLALLWQKYNTCWVRKLFVSVTHRCRGGILEVPGGRLAVLTLLIHGFPQHKQATSFQIPFGPQSWSSSYPTDCYSLLTLSTRRNLNH